MIKDFGTLNEFFNKEDKGVTNGDYVQTYGYNAINDGGSGLYKVKSLSASEPATITFSGLDVTYKGCTLELIPENGTVRVEQFGAVGNYSFENMTADEKTAFYVKNKNTIQAAVDSGASRVEFSPGTYYVAEDIIIDHPVDIVGNGAKLVLETDSTSTQLFRVEYSESVDIAPASIIDIKVVGTRVEMEDSVNYYNILINIVNAEHLTISNVYFEYGNYAIFINSFDSFDSVTDIAIENCTVKYCVNALSLTYAEKIKITNCKIEFEGINDGYGVRFMQGTKNVFVEDLSIYDAEYPIYMTSVKWNNIATERIVFKNLLIDRAYTAIYSSYCDIPVYFSNAIIVNSKRGFFINNSTNISMNNSSMCLLPPNRHANKDYLFVLGGYAQAKFLHTQFDFSWKLQSVAANAIETDPIELSFVDCTFQKTDNPNDPKVVESIGFGQIGYMGNSSRPVIEIFDACEFRSCIDVYQKDTTNSVEYNSPVTISTVAPVGSKLIIKNSRFVNESTCSIPYFLLDDSKEQDDSSTYDNIVIYNCMFENFSYGVSDSDVTHFYMFGKIADNEIVPQTSGYNIFAKCNMRSSEPVRNTGTTINEMKSYI